MKVFIATNVVIALAPSVTVHWPKVVVHPGFESFFGIIGYTTLKAGHAVIDVERKTITMTK